jgi:hypothetical protein
MKDSRLRCVAVLCAELRTQSPTPIRRHADFFCGKLNGITFPYSSGGIRFVAFFLKPLGTTNSMIFAITHPTCKNKTGAKKFSFLTNSPQMPSG